MTSRRAAGNPSPARDWFRFTAYGNLASFDWWQDENSCIDVDVIADWIVEHDDPLENDDLREILTAAEEEVPAT